MSLRTLAEVEAEATLMQKRREAFDRIVNGRLSPEEERIERERLFAIGAELATLEAKNAPPEPPRVYSLHELWQLTPEQAAQKAAAIRADPRYWDPSKANEKGERLSQTAHATLVQGHSELLARATGEGIETASHLDHALPNGGRP